MNAASSCGPAPGIARALARQRAPTVRQPGYRLKLEIPEAPSMPVTGHVRIRFEVRDGAGWPAIDFAPVQDDREAADCITGFKIDGISARYRMQNGHLLIDTPGPTAGFHTVEIEFRAGTTGLIRRRDLVYTLFVPARAHCIFPCFDQPDLKAPLELELVLPSDWSAIANAPESSRETAEKRIHIRFAKTESLPTYLFAFAAGRLQFSEHVHNGREVAIATVPADARALARNRDEILRLQTESIAFLEQYTGIPHPFAKLAIVLIPDFEFSGMEHPGAIFYRADAVLLDKSASLSAQIRRAGLIAHETAHLWFGDLVTMPWFDDVWLKEACANFMADKLVSDLYPETDHKLAFFLRHLPPALAIDRSQGTHAIRRPLENLADAGERYDALIYHKAPMALAELERMIGTAPMQAGMRQYLQDFGFGCGDWTDLLTRFERAAGCDLSEFSRTWLETAGPPACAPGFDPARLPVYGRPALSAAERNTAIHSLTCASSALERAVSWGTLYENMLDGGIGPAELLTAACAGLSREESALLEARIVADLYEIFWRFMPAAERGFAAGAIERCLWLRLNSVADAHAAMREILFWLNSLRQLAVTAESWSALRAIAAGEHERIHSLPESMIVDLVLTSALHDPVQSAGLIERNLTGLTSSRQRSRLRFLRTAVSDERGVRDQLFACLIHHPPDRDLTVKALRLLNHPLNASAAVDYIKPGIGQAASFGRNNEIFLARRWLSALFHGHGTETAAASIRESLDTTDLTPGFRDLAMETADPVFRAAAIRARSAYP